MSDTRIVLASHPLCCCLLGLPGLQQLLRNQLQLLRISGGINRAIQPFKLKLLSQSQGNTILHRSFSLNGQILQGNSYKFCFINNAMTSPLANPNRDQQFD